MKKGSLLTGKVIRLDYPNKGIVQTDEGLLEVACALPGQTVLCRVKKTRHGIGEGILKEVVAPSPGEVESPCPHFSKCGGCLYQTCNYKDELQIKEDQVKRLIEPVLGGSLNECRWESIQCSPVYEGYRNKMEFTFGDEYKDGPLALGMHKRGSMYDIVTVTGCRIADQDYSEIIRCTVDLFGSKRIPYYHRLSHVGYLRHLLVRRSRSGELLIGLVTSTQFGIAGSNMTMSHSEPEMMDSSDSTERETSVSLQWFGSAGEEQFVLEEYVSALRDMEKEGRLSAEIAGIIHIVNDSVADAVKADRVDILYGCDHITEELLGLKFRITPFSFFQTNTYGAEVLYSKVRKYAAGLEVPPGGTIFDLYSGTGTIAQVMAGMNDGSAAKVVGVEIVEVAVEAARINAAANGLTNCSFIAGDVLKVLDDLTDKPDLIILDPPREGIHPKALPKILSYGTPYIIYISCKPTSLANDLPAFLEAGYRPLRICTVDQFPRTGNIETVCLLSKGDVKSQKLRVEFSLEDMDTDGFKKGATYNAIRDWIKAKYGYRVTNLNIAQVKQKHGIIERENYNKPKSPDSKQPGCPEKKVKAIEDALRHFQMI